MSGPQTVRSVLGDRDRMPERQRRRLSAKMKRDAEARRCPSCDRKSALRRGIECRWCDWRHPNWPGL